MSYVETEDNYAEGNSGRNSVTGPLVVNSNQFKKPQRLVLVDKNKSNRTTGVSPLPSSECGKKKRKVIGSKNHKRKVNFETNEIGEVKVEIIEVESFKKYNLENNIYGTNTEKTHTVRKDKEDKCCGEGCFIY